MDDIGRNSTSLNATMGNNFTIEEQRLDSICDGSEIYWQSHGVKAMELYAYPVVIIVGSVMNLFAIAVLLTRTYRGTSTGFLLTALSLADLGLLVTGILRMWIKSLTDGALDVRGFSAVSCKLHIFFTYLFQYVSSWTLALITIERSICVCSPFKCKELCSLKKIVIGWLVILVAMVAVNAQFFWTFDQAWNEDLQKYECHGLGVYRVFLYEGAHNWMDLMFPCFGPFAVIIVCNVVIVSKLMSGVAQRKDMKVSTPASQQTSSTTVMLLCVSTMFLVLVGPFAVFSLGESYHFWEYNDAYDCARLEFTYSFTYLLFNINSAINFLLYCMSGTKFRRVFVALFSCFPSLSDNKSTGSKNPSASDRISRNKSGASGTGKRTGSRQCTETVMTSYDDDVGNK